MQPTKRQLNAANLKRKQEAEAKPWPQKGWLVLPGGFRYMMHNGKAALVHRVLWESVHGPIPNQTHLEFINGDKTDIRIDNLRLRSKGGKRPLTPAQRVERTEALRQSKLRRGLTIVVTVNGEPCKQCPGCQQMIPLATGYYPRGRTEPRPRALCKQCSNKATRRNAMKRRERAVHARNPKKKAAMATS